MTYANDAAWDALQGGADYPDGAVFAKIDGRRLSATPWSIIACDGPQIAGFRLASPRIEHWTARLVGEELRRGLQNAHEPIVQGRQLEGREADPVRQRRAIDPHAFARQDLRLTVKGKVVGIFRDEHVGDERLRRQAALDQPVRGKLSPRAR
jgi:hypothetical protein